MNPTRQSPGSQAGRFSCPSKATERIICRKGVQEAQTVMAEKYIPLFLDFNETTQDLTDEQCGRLIREIVRYANGESSGTQLQGMERIAFRFMKGSIDRNLELSAARARAGAKGAE